MEIRSIDELKTDILKLIEDKNGKILCVSTCKNLMGALEAIDPVGYRELYTDTNGWQSDYWVQSNTPHKYEDDDYEGIWFMGVSLLISGCMYDATLKIEVEETT